MIRTPFKKQSRNPRTMIFFFMIMSVLTALLLAFIFTPLYNEYPHLVNLDYCLFIVAMVFSTISWCMNPGYIEKDPQLDFI